MVCTPETLHVGCSFFTGTGARASSATLFRALTRKQSSVYEEPGTTTRFRQNYAVEGEVWLYRLCEGCGNPPKATQDNTHPEPVFKARVLRNEYDAKTERYVFGQLLMRSFQRCPFRGLTLFLLRNNVAFNIGPGVGVRHTM